MNIRYPNITGASPAEQLAQIRGYLFQLVEQLNMESEAKTDSSTGLQPDRNGSAAGVVSGLQRATPASTFNQIKSLIIKSADIVDAYYDQINIKLESLYVAESEFGTYCKQAEQDITANAEGVKMALESIQTINGQVEQVIKTNAGIRTGLLFVVGDENLEPELGQTLPEGAEVHGIEIGQTTEVNGTEVFNKFARFTAYGMTLYDKNGDLTAYITDKRLNIPNAVITGTLTRGGFEETINNDGSSVERWVGV